MKKLILVIFFLICTVYIYSGVGSTGWIIFRKVQSPKPRSLTTVAAIRGDVSGVLYNPAILATIENKELFTMAEVGITEDKLYGIIYGYPLKRSGVSVGVLNYNLGKDVLYWIEGDKEVKSQEITLQDDYLGFISYGRQISNKIVIGITAKFATTKVVEAIESKAYAVDIGGSYFFKNVVISLAGQNLGVSEKFVDKEEKLPMSVYLAVGYSGVIKEFDREYYYVIGCDVPYLIDENRPLAGVGLEIGKEPFGIFVGYRANVTEANLSVGISLNFKKFDFGYTYIPTTYLKPLHRVSLGVKF